MPKSYKLKIILGGSKGVGKTSFINGNIENDTPIGVSFKPIECYANEADSYKFVVWDLKDRLRFRFLFPIFCRGACAGLLCFDLSDRDSFLELNNWLTLFRESIGNIPIILIGTKSDLKRKISNGEISNFMTKNHLKYVFLTSIYDEIDKKKEIFQTIVEKLDPNYQINDFNIFSQNQLDTEEFNSFIDNFSFCPICKKDNHFENLKNLYISRDPKIIKLREQLLKLIEISNNLKFRSQKISIGIPCCNCYKSIFEKELC